MRMNVQIAILTVLLCATGVQAQTKRTDAFHAKYNLKEVAQRYVQPLRYRWDGRAFLREP